MDALENTLARLSQLGSKLRKSTHTNDLHHFRYQLETIQYGIDRLAVTLHPGGIARIRNNLKASISDAWFGLMMKRVPRFFTNEESEGSPVSFDTESHNWSPEFYKLAEAWPILSSTLKDKTVLDPFAGAGSLMNLLVARGIPSAAFYSDIAYPGGMPVNGSGRQYQPSYNLLMSQLLFDDLPSWYRPNFTAVKGFVTADAFRLPFADNSVDMIFSDPPYGKNLNEGSLGLLIGCLPELMRVSREGVVMMVPEAWLKEMRAARVPFTQLTKDVSQGVSRFPICYVQIDKKELS